MQIAAENPDHGSTAGGEVVEITGQGFAPGAAVLFDGIPSASVTFRSATLLAAAAPAHAPGQVALDVVMPDGSRAHRDSGYTYLSPPVVSSIEPGQVPPAGGVAIVILGTGFQPGATVRFGDVPAQAEQWIAAEKLTAVAPPHAAGRADVKVTNPDGQVATLAGGLAYADPVVTPPPAGAPTLTAVAPASGPTTGGTQVTLAGTGFATGATVRFGAASATVSSVQPTQIVVVTPNPAPAGLADIVVTNPDGQVVTQAGGFTFVAPPVPAPAVTSAAPSTGPGAGGSAVVLTGTGFQAGATVAFGGTAAAIAATTVVGTTRIDVTAPAHASGAADVVVTNPDGQKGTLAAGFSYAVPAPTLASLSVARGPIAGATAVTLAGTGFEAGAAVSVGGVPATVVSVSATSIAITTPAHATGPADVLVTNPDGQSATLPGAFTYLGSAPTVTALAPSTGPAASATAVTVTGTGFAAGATVTFAGLPMTVTARSATSLTVTAPAHAAGPADVLVTNPDGQSAAAIGGFTWLAPAPTVTSSLPATGPDAGGITLVVTGTGFQQGASVSFGGATAIVLSTSATSITLTSPVHPPGASPISVTNPDGQTGSSATSFTFTAAPSVATLAPASGPAAGGTLVTVSGASFQTGATVTVGGSPVAVTFVNAQTLTFTAPAHATGPADVVVTNPAPDARQAVKTGAFSFVGAPSIASMSPATGFASGNQTLTLAGAGFVSPSVTVTVGGAAATVLTSSLTQVTVNTPPGAPGAAAVVLTNPDGQKATAATSFTYVAAPTLASLSTASGPAAGGSVVTLTGNAFQAGATVTVGGLAATAGAITPTTVAITTPPHAAGSADVVVTNPDGQKGTLAAAFLYVSGPVIATVAPSTGPTAGGTTVLVSGTGFQPGSTVTVGGLTPTSVSVTAGVITLVTPAAPAVLVADVVVISPDGQQAISTGAFTWLAPPALASLAPASGSTAGGDAVTLAGSGFRPGATVLVGGITAAVNALTLTPTTIAIAAPPHAAGLVSVTVTNSDGQASSLAAAYNYVASPPSLLSLAPTSGPALGGTTVLLTGGNFSGASVTVGGLPATIAVAGTALLRVTIPAHPAGPADVVVTNADGQKATLLAAFTYLAPAPAVASLAPASGPTAGGTSVAVTGSGFQPGATVSVGGALATTVGTVTATSLAFTAPPHTFGAASLVVTNPDGQSFTAPAAFTYLAPPPTLGGVLPVSGPLAGGTAVTVTGSGFAAGATVTLGATPVVGAVVAPAGTSITFTTPPHAAGPATLAVTNPDGQTTGPVGSFTFLAPPALAAVAPLTGPVAGGTVLALTGSGFQAGATVLVGGLPASSVVVTTSTSLSAVAPPHAAGIVDVAVTNPDGQTSTLPAAFTYRAPPPTIASIAPPSGPDAGGITVVVTGAGFQPGASVSFGGAPALVLSTSPTALTVSTPVHAAGAVDVVVTNSDGQSVTATAGFAFLPPPPIIAAVTPTSGSTTGATPVTVSGSGFQAGATVSVGGAPATIGTVTATSISISSPPHAAGPADVVVTNPDGQKATSAGAFTFVAPAPSIAAISPSSGPTAGGTTILLTGSAFQQGATVSVGGTLATVGTVTGASIAFTTPAHAFGAVDIVVANPDGKSTTLTAGFTYVAPAPTFAGVLPASGPTAGGAALTISGTGFLPGATVAIGGAVATPATVSSATTIAVTAPPHAFGAVNVVVTNPDGKSVTGPSAYTYFAPAPALASVAPALGVVAGGTAVTLTGTGFLPGATVSIGGLSAPVATSGPTSIVVTAPAHAAGAADVVVANPDLQTASLLRAFTYRLPGPTVAGVAPATGVTIGGAAVTVTGSGFQVGATVALGGAPATGVTVASSTSLSFVTPPAGPGPATLVVTNPDGQAATRAAVFTYLLPPPVLQAVSPATGPDVGGTSAVLSGTGFQAGASVTFGGVGALVLSSSATSTSITVTTPTHAAGVADVVVTNPDAQASTLAAAFTFTGTPPPPAPAPALVSISPLSGPDAGGTTAVLTGSNFQAGAAVTVGGTPATVLSLTATTISISTPAHAAGSADVVVTNPDGQKATLLAAFTFVAPPPAITSIAPASGPGAGGTALVVTGSGFQPLVSVTVGGLAASVVASSPASMTVTTPPHTAGAAAVVVTNPDGQKTTAATLFTYLASPPVIATVTPTTGSTAGGTSVVVAGTGFQTGATVTLGGVTVASPAVTATSIAFTTPAHAAGAVALVVSNPDGQSAALGAAFTFVTPPPALVSIAPASGSTLGGALVTATGSGFQPGATVTVGGTPATGVAVGSSTILTFTAPGHAAGAVAVAVTNPDGQSASLPLAFSYVSPAPSLSAVAPASGLAVGGTAMTLTGANFQAGATVTVGGLAATVGAVTPASIAITTPAHAAGLADVLVTNLDGQSATLAGAFRYLLPAPAIGTVSPASGPVTGATLVTVTGSAFQAGAAVTLGGTPVVATVAATAITFATPAHAAGPAALVVANPDGQSATLAAAFTFVAPPVLVSLAPASGSTLGGTSVALSGSGFASGATVAVGGLPATVLSSGPIAIAITTPPHAAGPADVVVTNPDGQKTTLAAAFTYIASLPAIASLAPASGPTAGGTAITVAGSAFQPGAAIAVGGLAATVTASSATSLTALAPAHAAGPVDVVVTNPDGQKATAVAAFTYLAPPALTSVAPASGSTLGGTAATLTGTGFQAGATVLVGGCAAAVGTVTATSLAITTPAHAPGLVAVTVTNPDGQTSTLTTAYTYLAPPTVVSLTPTSGTTAGGTAVSVSGSGLQQGATVSLGGVPVTVVVTTTSLAFTTPAHAAGVVSLAVTNPDGQGTTVAAAFSYVAPPAPPPTITSVAPGSGATAGGSPVTITGTGFQALAAVTVGGLPAAIGTVTATGIVITSPPHAAGPADVVVRNPDGQTATAAAAFTYLAPPSLASIAPPSGPSAGATLAVLSGAAFQAGASVTVGGVAAAVGTVTALTVAITTPPHAAGAADVVLTNPDGQKATLAAAFNYVAPPLLVSIAPATGPTAGGSAVALTGSAFQPGATVTVGGASAAIVGVITSTSISITAPPHTAGPADVVVTNFDGQKATLASAFSYLAPPTLALATPSSGPTAGATAVTLAGSGFQPGATLTVGGTAAPATVVTAASLTFLTPAHPSGAADIVLTNPDGQKATLVAGFSYVAAPALASVAPVTGLAAGGTGVTLVGTAFQPGATVTFGGVSALVGTVTATTINLTAPPHAPGAVDVVVTNLDGQKSTLTAAFSYALPAPTLASLLPAVGPDAGGSPLALTGTGFQTGATVTFGGVLATLGTVAPTAITLTTPPHAVGAVDVVVTNPDGQKASRLAAFTYRLPAPSVSSVAPTFGPDAGGTTVVLSGTGFQPGAAVSFGGTPAIVLGTPTATAITVTTAAHAAGPVAVTVTNPDAQSASLAAAFSYRLPAPTIAVVTPSSGPVAGGSTVTVSGSGFQLGATAALGVTSAIPSSIITATALSFVTPSGVVGPASLAVTNPDGQSFTLPAAFTYVAPPAITSVTPTSGSTAGGTVIAIAGTGFLTGATVTVGAAATAGTVTATGITATTPAHVAGPVDVVVTNPDLQKATAPAAFTFTAPAAGTPTLVSVTPNQGSTGGGTTAVLTGTNFVAGATVSVGAVAATVTGLSATAISCTTGPHAAGPGDVVVTNPDGQSATLAAAYTYLVPAPPITGALPPVLLSVSPASGLASGGTVIFLGGTDFQLGATVLVGGLSAPVTIVLPGAITIAAPAHAAGLVDVTVVNPDGQSSTLPLAYTYLPLPPLPPPPVCPAPPALCIPPPTAPTIATVTPATGATTGGDTVNITGTNFDPAALVTFDVGNFATVVISTPTGITVTTPPHAAGLISVTVTNPDGWAAVFPASFTYAVAVPKPPRIRAITPASGFESGGNTVTITGSDFVAGGIVKFGATAVTAFGVRSTQLVMFAPPHAPGTVDVTVTNPDGQSVSLPAAYTFSALPAVLPLPTATSLAPNTGPVAGGTPVAIAGTNFVAGTKVFFDGLQAVVASFSSTSIVANAPPHPASGFVDVSVVNPDGQVATLQVAFLYLGAGPVINTVAPRACPMAGGGTAIVAGLNIQAGATVTFGGVPGIAPSWDPLNKVLKVTVPAGPGGIEAFVNVVVTNPDGLVSPAFPQFRYGAPPVVTGFTPSTITAGKVQCQLMTITGTDFSVQGTGAGHFVQILVGGNLAPFVPDPLWKCNNVPPIPVATSTSLTVVLPATPPGSYRIIVTNFDGQFSAAPGVFLLPGP